MSISHFLKLAPLITIFSVCFTVPALAEKEAFFGSWSNTEDSSTLEILDGFSPNIGAVLVTDENGDISAGKWTYRSGEFNIQIRSSSRTAEMDAEDSFTWNRRSFVREQLDDRREDSRIMLRQDPRAFVDALTASRWRTTLDTQSAIFQTTFSTDSGVVSFSDSDQINEVSGWGLSSGILRIGSQTIADARVSGRYFVGVTDRDDFVVFIRDGLLEEADRTSLEDERAEFFDRLLTDDWVNVQRFRRPSNHRFRAIDGELKGRVFETTDGRLTSANQWEYSPGTGALKIGFTEYVGAIVVGDTLALLRENGDQAFFIRPEGEQANRRFNLSDVNRIPLSETNLDDIAEILSTHFSSQDYTYLFEFSNNKRDGFIHEFRSIPFNITAETFTTDLFSRSGALYEVEEFVVFDGARSFMRDPSLVRLAPQSEDAAREAAASTQERIERAGESGITLRITDESGQVHNIEMPVASFGDIRSFEIIRR